MSFEKTKEFVTTPSPIVYQSPGFASQRKLRTSSHPSVREKPYQFLVCHGTSSGLVGRTMFIFSKTERTFDLYFSATNVRREMIAQS